MGATETITDVNQKVIGSVSNISWLTVIGWIIFILITIGGIWWVVVYYKNKKQYNKRITALEMVGEQWVPAIKDVAKTVKIGKGGFEILYLKKTKTWKIAYGGRAGRLDYYFFIMPDGYWYNSTFLANVHHMDKNKGLVPVFTTNPLMRGQYTALEKQIDLIHGDKAKWWDRYGTYVLSVAFILISGMMLWLMFKEYSSALSKLSEYHIRLGDLLDKLNNLASNIQSGQDTGLVKV